MLSNQLWAGVQMYMIKPMSDSSLEPMATTAAISNTSRCFGKTHMRNMHTAITMYDMMSRT